MSRFLRKLDEVLAACRLPREQLWVDFDEVEGKLPAELQTRGYAGRRSAGRGRRGRSPASRYLASFARPDVYKLQSRFREQVAARGGGSADGVPPEIRREIRRDMLVSSVLEGRGWGWAN